MRKGRDGVQEILSFTRVDGSNCINMLDLLSRKRKFGQCNRSSNAKRLKYRLYDKKMYREGDNGLKNFGMCHFGHFKLLLRKKK